MSCTIPLAWPLLTAEFMLLTFFHTTGKEGQCIQPYKCLSASSSAHFIPGLTANLYFGTIHSVTDIQSITDIPVSALSAMMTQTVQIWTEYNTLLNTVMLITIQTKFELYGTAPKSLFIILIKCGHRTALWLLLMCLSLSLILPKDEDSTERCFRA